MTTAASTWCLSSLGSLASYLNGRSFGPEDWGVEGLPIVRIEQLLNPKADTDFFSGVLEAKNRIDSGDLVFSWSATLAIRQWDRGPAALNQHLFKVIPKAGVNPRFLHHLIEFHIEDLAEQSHGSTMRHIKRGDLAAFPVFIPEEPEQARIAEVLDTFDVAIQGTALVIDKLEHSRQGALRELLTCGLDQAGRVRWRGERTLFKDTPIGALPRDWSVAPLGAVLDRKRDPAMRSGPFGSALLKQDLVEEGHPLIGIDNVEVERFVPNFTRFITPAKFSDLSRYRSFPNDVLITIMGTVGRCCMVPEGLEDALTTKHVWALSVDPDLYSPFLACLQINHAPWALRHLNGDQQGGIMSAIRAETLRSVLLPVPPKEEREAIEAVLRSMGEAIKIEQKRIEKLQALKSGLSTDLLTGHVRTQ